MKRLLLIAALALAAGPATATSLDECQRLDEAARMADARARLTLRQDDIDEFTAAVNEYRACLANTGYSTRGGNW